MRWQRRQGVVGPRQLLSCLYIGLWLLLLAPGGAAGAAERQWQHTDDIRAAAEAYLRDRIGNSSGHTTVEAGALDPRHRLPLCDADLHAFMRRGTTIGPRTIIGVRCSGTTSWTVHIPVNVFVSADILVAARTLPPGHLITASDLTRDRRDVSRMNAGYVTDAKELIGQRLKQQLIAGRPYTLSLVQADRLVKRGQTVTLVASSGGINVSMAGKALTDGAMNQRIRVENLNSGRIVEGIVRSREQVEILLPGTRDFSNATPKVTGSTADTQASNNDR
ncbi:MAG: flagellar basal body P-ring formation chaperone FlgA [Woeseiaceae bacterium]|nr:flagellar basal body P-ring formation chaperone FlgA [Woeseiaceae bacterium]